MAVSLEIFRCGTCKFKSYCVVNKLSMNLPNTSLMILGTRQNLAHNNKIEVYLDNQLIENVQKQKLLGVIVDPTLSWDKQADSALE